MAPPQPPCTLEARALLSLRDAVASIEFVRIVVPERARTALELAARRLPEEWQVRIAANATPALVVEVTIAGPGIEAVFGAGAITKLVRGGDFEAMLTAVDEVRRAYADVGLQHGSGEARRRRRRSS